MGSLGFLAGPPVFGFFADAISLPWSLSLLILGAVVVFALARRAAGRARARARRPSPTRSRCHDPVRRRDLRPRRRARRLHGRHEPRLGGVGRRGTGSTAPRSRPPTTASRRREVVAAASCRRSGVAEEAAVLERLEVEDTRGRRRAAGRRRACSRSPSSPSPPPACIRSPARGSAPPGWSRPRCSSPSDQVAHGKPAPDSYLLAAERLGARPGGLPRARGRARAASRPGARPG